MSLRVLISSAALIALSACSGGGVVGVDLNAGDADFDGLDIETDRLKSYLMSPPTAVLPTMNVVNYDGVILMGDDLDPAGGVSATGYLGQVDIDVDFSVGARSIDGTAGNFYAANLDALGDPDSEIGSVAGALTLTGGDFATNDFNFDVDGTVDTMLVDGSMTGSFALPGAVAFVSSDDPGFMVGIDEYDAAIIAD